VHKGFHFFAVVYYRHCACYDVQDTGLWNRLRAVKAIVMEPRASDKENFDKVMRQFYDIVKNCSDSGV